jgi:Glycosyltransferase family 87
MNAKFRVAALSLALIVLAGLVLLLVRPGLNPARIRPMPLLIGAWLAFIAAAWLLRKVPRRVSVAAILLGGIAVQLVAVSAPSQNSTDLYRYVWDGRVQAAGIDPYAYVPAASQLTGLRDQGQDFLWRADAQYCVTPSQVSSQPAADLAAGCTAINRPIYPTIYPPVAEAYFLGVHYLPSGNDSTTPIQATTAFVAVLTTVLLLFGLGRLGRDIRMAALWSWCPTVALEAGNSAHVDVVAVAITAAAVLLLATARTTRRTVLGGILLGLAIATKLTPALTVPALLRRRWLTVTIAAGSAFVAVYIPHVLAVGGKVIGFLPGYLQQEGYTGGTRFGIIGLFFTGPLAVAVAALILGAVAFAVLQFGDPGRPWEGALYMTAAALAVATPSYQWYSLLLVMLVALDGRPEWLAFAAGGYYAAEPSIGRYTVPYRLHLAVAYGVPVLVVAAGWLVRRALAGRGLGVTRRGFGIAGTAPVLASPAVTAAPDAAASIAVTPEAVAPALAEARPVAGLAGASPVAGLAGARPVAGFAEARSVAGLAAPDDSFDAFSPRPVPAGEPRDVRVEAARR